ncbi:hypothetical protein FDB61_15740 [Clostridium botulinum]|nr:hypothetical protein [Clostridium botulinum]NFL43139.1 hypothetical protein [Clostridium botulinum]
MSILIEDNPLVEIMDLINRTSRDNAVLLCSMNGNLTDDEKYLYRYIKKKNRKYLKLLKTLDKSKSNNTLKSIIEKWVECEITGDEAMSQIIKFLNISV